MDSPPSKTTTPRSRSKAIAAVMRAGGHRHHGTRPAGAIPEPRVIEALLGSVDATRRVRDADAGVVCESAPWMRGGGAAPVSVDHVPTINLVVKFPDKASRPNTETLTVCFVRTEHRTSAKRQFCSDRAASMTLAPRARGTEERTDDDSAWAPPVPEHSLAQGTRATTLPVMTTPPLDVDRIRRQFPACRALAAIAAVFFDGPAGARCPQSVADAMAHYRCTRTPTTAAPSRPHARPTRSCTGAARVPRTSSAATMGDRVRRQQRRR